MYEEELRDELTKMWDDPDFASGALCYLDTDEQRKQVLNGVRAGTLNNPTKVFNTVMEIAGFATTCDEE